MWATLFALVVLSVEPTWGRNCFSGFRQFSHNSFESNCTTKRQCQYGRWSDYESHNCPGHSICVWDQCRCDVGFGAVVGNVLLRECRRMSGGCEQDDVYYLSGDKQILSDDCTQVKVCVEGQFHDLPTQMYPDGNYTCPSGSQCVNRSCVPCDHGYIFFKKELTCIKIHEDNEMDWDDARTHCQDDGGDLVEIHGEAMNTFVKEKLKPGVGYWMGVYGEVEHWTYVGGEPVTDYHPWYYRARPHINNWGQKWRWCLEIMGNDKGAWNEKSCRRHSKPFVCQKPLSVI